MLQVGITDGRRGGWASPSENGYNNGYTKVMGPEVGNATFENRGHRRGRPYDSSTSALLQIPAPTVVEPTPAKELEKRRRADTRHEQLVNSAGRVGRRATTKNARAAKQLPKRRPSMEYSRQTSERVGPRRRRVSLDSSAPAVVSQEQGDHDEEGVEAGLIITSARCPVYEGSHKAGAVPAGGDFGSDGARPPVEQTNPDAIAPFHGPVPASFSHGSGGRKCSNDKMGSGGANDVFLGIPGTQQGFKVFQQRLRPAAGNQAQYPPPRDTPQAGAATSSAKVVPIVTWGSVDGTRGPGRSKGTGNNTKGGGDDEVSIRSAERDGEIYDDGRGDAGYFDHHLENHTPRLEPTTSAMIADRKIDHHVHPPPPLRADVAPVTLNASAAESTNTTTANAAATTSGRVSAAAGYSKSVSGTSVPLPSRDRRQGSMPLGTGGGTRAGANRRRVRREQTRATDGSATSDGSRLSVSAIMDVVVSATANGGTSANASTADLEGMAVVASGMGGTGGRRSTGGGVGPRSSSVGGWRTAGGSLANLKARMGVKNKKKSPRVGGARGGVLVDGDQNGRGGGNIAGVGGRAAQHIPYQAF